MGKLRLGDLKIPCFPSFVIALVASCLAVGASSPDLVVLDFKTYASPSGRYQLEVDPTERYGAGPGNCTLSEGGRVVWAARVPFTFFEAQVTEEGTVAGYGYTHGETGFSITQPFKAANELRAAIFDPAGKQLLNVKIPRELGSYVDAGFGPSASGMLLRDGLFILRIPGESEEIWNRYRLPTGETLTEARIKPPAAAGAARCFVEQAVPITGTTLTLLRWWRQNDEPPETGAVFALVEPDGKTVWELPRLTDYSALPDGERECVNAVLRREGAVSAGIENGSFELWFTSVHERVLHSVQKAGDAWTVQEVSRRPAPLPPPVNVAEPPPIAAPGPEKLGVFSLDAPSWAGPVYDVRAFGFDDRGHIGFLSGSEHFVLMEQSGGAVMELPLNLPNDARMTLAWMAGDRWLVTASGWGDAAKTRAWWIDARQKSLTEVVGFTCPPTESLAGSGDGGFVVLTKEWQKSTSIHAVAAFDAAGALRWKVEANSGKDGGAFISPKSVTVTTKGEVAVLDVIRRIVVLFDLTGKYLRTVDLKIAWKREPNYPSQITADQDGGFVVGDFNGKPPFVRMTADGKVRAQFSPVFKDGRLADQSGELRVAPDGRMWLANRHSLLRLDDDGMVEAILGQPPGSNALGVIAAAACDDAGRIAVVDHQTGAVHVFDAEGHRRKILQPGKNVFAGPAGGGPLDISNDGRILLNPSHDEQPAVLFGIDGKRLNLKLKPGSGWSFRQGAGGMLRLGGSDDITLTDDSGSARQFITHQPDRRWLDFATSMAVAQDGSFVVRAGREETATALNFYGPKGEPLRTVTAPVPGWFEIDGWSGKHLLLSTETEILLCDRRGKPIRRLVPDARRGQAQFFTRGGREWLVLDFGTRTVTRWEVPPGE